MVSEPDVEIQLMKGNIEIQRYFKPQTIQVVGYKTLKIIDEKGNLVLRR